MFEIRFHARAGQGAKSAAQFLAEAALKVGKFVQAFPYFGPERRGAPMQAFVRISDKPIRVHSGVKTPQAVVVIDSSLLSCVNVTAGLGADGILLINTNTKYQIPNTRYKIYTIDASKIAMDLLKRDIPNTVLLGALVKITKLVKLEDLLGVIEKKFSKKLGPELTKANLEAIKKGYDQTK
jgi:pyruvate ferredoxin oxidoreductase gamma subunit